MKKKRELKQLPIAQLTKAVSIDAFHQSFEVGINVLSGRTIFLTEGIDGIQIPNLPPNAPMNISLLAFQETMRTAGASAQDLAASVQRYLALYQAPLNDSRLAELVIKDEVGNVIGLRGDLIRAAAIASMQGMNIRKPEFKPENLLLAVSQLGQAPSTS